jgi:hypothetical protein
MNHLLLTVLLLIVAVALFKSEDPRLQQIIVSVKKSIKIILIKLKIMNPRDYNLRLPNRLKDVDNQVPENPSTPTPGVNFDLSTNRTNIKNAGVKCPQPPYQRCYECDLDFQCSNYPYELSDTNESVCSKCNLLNKNNHQYYNSPTVMGRAAGRPRQCRKLF